MAVTIPLSGGGSLKATDGYVTEQHLGANAVKASKVTATMRTGFVPIPLTTVREIQSADVPALAAHGGILAKDTTPILERVNVGTDPSLRIKWAASNSDPITFSTPSPPDLDDSQVVTVKARAKMGGATDTPTITVAFWEDTGGSDLGSATAALSSSFANASVDVTVTATAASPKSWSVTLTPGAHTTDTLEIVALWIEYTRK